MQLASGNKQASLTRHDDLYRALGTEGYQILFVSNELVFMGRVASEPSAVSEATRENDDHRNHS